MPVFVIFVEGADTEPAKVPVYVVESEEHASLLCEGMKESEYAIFDFSFQHCTRSDRGKFAVWVKMIEDARKGVYGNIVGGMNDMIDGAYSIMSGRRSREKIASGADAETGTGGLATQDDGTADDRGMPSADNPFVGLLQEFRDACIEFDRRTRPLLAYTDDERCKSERIQSGRVEVIACVSWPRADATKKSDYLFFVATESNDAVRPMQDRFKQLSTLAGASLPVMIRDSIRGIVLPDAEPLNPLEWWIAFLWFHNPPAEETMAWADELTEGHWAIWNDPFLASIEAIERCGLHIGEIRFPASVAKLAADTQESTHRSPALTEVAESLAQPEAIREPYLFRRNGANFAVRFDGEKGGIPTNLNGAWYIYWLLQSPHKKLDAKELREKLMEHQRGETPAPDGTGTDSDAEDQIEFLKQGAANLAKQIEQSRAAKDQSKVDQLLGDLKQVKNKIDGLRGKGGKPRTEGSSADRASVSRAIQVVKLNCRDKWGLAKLAKHLEFISKGDLMVYQPQGDAPDWQF